MRNLITAQEVIELAFAENSNMMAESISDTSIRIAEIKYIRPAFGAMYPLLADKYAEYTNDFVKPALAYFVKCEIVSSIAIDMSNSGVAVANPQYQSAATDKQRQRLYDSEMSKAKILLDFALSYIAENKELFPDFSGEAPKKHHRLGGILLGNGDATSRQSASIIGDAFKAEYEKYLREMQEIKENVEGITQEAEEAANKATDLVEKADTAITEANKAATNANTATTQANTATTAANEAAERAENIAKDLEGADERIANKADTDGYYPAMSVGMADNLVGRGDVQDARINFRPSAGADNITDHAARIERIKGNSVVWNQLVNTDSTSVELIAKRTYFTDINGEQSVRIISATTNIDVQFGRDKVIDLTQMFGAGNEPTTVEDYHQRKPMNIEDEFAYNAGTFVDMHANKIISTSDNAYDYTKGYARVMGGYKYDITANAGATLVVSFYADGEDSNEEREIAPDSEGKYTFPANGICYVNGDFASRSDICVCLNHSYDKPHPAYQQEVKDLSFIGEAFPEGMRRTPNAMDDYRNIIPNTDVFDEIRYNSTKKVWEKVTRIGVARGLKFILGSVFYCNIPDIKPAAVGVYYERRNGLLSNKYSAPKNVSLSTMEDKCIVRWSDNTNVYIKDSAYTTAEEFNEANKDLVIYYELAKPIVEEIDLSQNFNLDYFAWDFGTEEAIVPNNAPSAPFRADINYEPNAVDDLRWAVSEIRSLKAQIAQMSASVSETNLTE